MKIFVGSKIDDLIYNLSILGLLLVFKKWLSYYVYDKL